jgi:hypothetical protein
MKKNYLYGLTVQGIQSYIFATNKLKEIIGASEIIEQLCITWYDDFLKENNIEGTKLLNAAGNIRFQTDEATAKLIFEEYHLKLLKEAPGVPFSQAVVKIDNNNQYKAIQDLDKKLRGQRNSPLYETDLGIMTRSKYRPTGSFAGLENEKVKDENKFVDAVTSAKYNHCDEKELTKKVNITTENFIYPSEFSELAKDSKHSWLAVVHIDGNGMGLIIKSILKQGKDKFKELQDFSTNVGKATNVAFKKAITDVVKDAGWDKIENDKVTGRMLPMRPIIIGGDDVMVIIRADLALEFTRVYLEAFEDETKTAKIKSGEGLTACAGIAYVKEKFPFHYSANLAEELCVYAKNKSKRVASCVQFHKVQDSIIDNYKEIVSRELTAKNTIFENGPYYIDKHNTDYIDKHNTEETIGSLTKDIVKLKNEDSPKNGIREWIDAKFNNPIMADTLMERLKGKTNGNYKGILKNEKAFIDYHTLLAINTKTD